MGRSFTKTAKVHCIFWIGYFLFDWVNNGIHFNDFERSFTIAIFNLPLLIIAGYQHLNFTTKRFYFQNRIVPLVVSLLFSVVCFGLARRAIFYYFLYPRYFAAALDTPFLYWPKIMYESTQLHLTVSLFIAIDLIRKSIYQQRLNDKYKQDKLEAEYTLLQSQVQPHFLFNTLNNLISVSLHQPKQMPDLLQGLAGLLHYQLHDSHQKDVFLTKEIEYLKDYITLEKIRYGDRLDVQTNFNEWKEKPDIEIPPMLLLPFVENAFKHGAALSEADCWIQIRISYNEGKLSFTVENSVSEDTSVFSTTNIGLNNLKRRLDILYPGNYTLNTLKEDGTFLAVLKFNIK